MKKFKCVCHKIASILEWIVGYALLICLFIGGLGLIGFIVALCIGGENATNICTWLYKTFYVYLIKVATITTVVCFIVLYLRGDANWINPIKYWKSKLSKKTSHLNDAENANDENLSSQNKLNQEIVVDNDSERK